MSDDLVSHMDMLDNAGQMLFDDFPNSMTETCIWAAAHIRALEAQLAQRDAALKAADDLARLIHRTGYRVDHDGNTTLLGMDAMIPIRNAIDAYRKARGQDETAKG